MARIPLVLALLCLAGCAATRRHFIPREGLNATSPRGWPAARYQLVIAGQSVGETKVWSEGAYRAEVGDDERTILHVGFEIENRSGEEMTFLVDRCQVVDAINDGDPLPDLRPFDEKDKLQVRTGQVGLIDLEFLLPRGLRPTDLDSFRVEWALSTSKGTFSESTPFRIDSARYYRPHYYYYDYDPWWGFGTGVVVGRVSTRVWWGPRWHWHHWHHHWH